MRILVIEDQPDILEGLAKILRRAGHQVALASDGKSGLSQVSDGNCFDAVVTDMLMPDTDGVEVIRELRRRCPDIWIVAISGGGDKVSAQYCLTLSRAFGTDRILYKPFCKAELLSAIERE
ncbi:MAG: response regulator [Stellaceae bacterium]